MTGAQLELYKSLKFGEGVRLGLVFLSQTKMDDISNNVYVARHKVLNLFMYLFPNNFFCIYLK